MATGDASLPSSRLDSNHRRRLLGEFRHMDELCAEMLTLCRAETSDSPFEEIVQDLPAASRAELQQGVEHLRRLMLQMLEERGIPVEKQTTRAAHAVRIRLHLIEIALEDLRPERMRGYGALTPEARRERLDVVETLTEALRPLQETYADRQD